MKYISYLILLSLISACSPGPDVMNSASDDIANVYDEIYIVNHGWHTGLIIPAKLIYSQIPELKKRYKDTRFIEFGWGDKEFYQSKEITIGLVVKALLWPTKSVIHTVSVPVKAEKHLSNSHIEKICLNGNEYSTLIRFIKNSFYKNDNKQIIKLEKGIYGDSQFYKGVGDYYLMNTCNKWTAKGLKSAGVDISTFFKLTASSVMNDVIKHNLAQTDKKCSLK